MPSPTTDQQSVQQITDSLLAQMTLEEKANMLAGRDMWHLNAVPRLNIPELRAMDCGHGATLTGEIAGCSTCLPTAVGQAATFNRDIIYKAGALLGRETRAQGCRILLGPMVNIHRVPVNGRNYETYSEDPFLAGTLAAALVNGIQSQHVAAVIKGFTANNQQEAQHETSVELDERTLREIYCPNFKIPITTARPLGVMTNYNKLRGVDTGQSKYLIRDILKTQWQYQGFVVSDWRATFENTIDAGLDLEMPGPGKFMRQQDILNALENNIIDENELNDRVRRILTAIVTTTIVGDRIYGQQSHLNTPEHQQIAREVAEQSITLLKNDHNTLPLDDSRIKTLAVIGPNAAEARLGGGGSASVAPFYSVSPLQGIINRLADNDTEIIHEEGCSLFGELPLVSSRYLSPPDEPDVKGLKVEFFVNNDLEGTPDNTIHANQIDYSWGWAAPAHHIPRNDWSARWTGRLTPDQTGTHKLAMAWKSGGARLYINDELKIDQWNVSKSDELKPVYEDFFQSLDIDLTENQPVDIRIEYRKVANKSALRLEWQRPDKADPVKQAAAAAANADAAIIFAGLCNIFEGGTNDRKTFQLPGRQEELIAEVIKANPNTIVVLINGTPVDMNAFNDAAPAILEAYYPGQEGGNALANIIFGDVNPSGKLPDTIPASWNDVLAMQNYPGTDGKCFYKEGVYVGYRHFDSHNVTPLYPFGHGLSYTTFQFSNIKTAIPSFTSDQNLDITVDITNTGQHPGHETAQLYLRDLQPTVDRPMQELKGFEKIFLNPGQTQTVTFTITQDDLAFFNNDTNAWQSNPGPYEAMIGPSSRQGITCQFQYEK